MLIDPTLNDILSQGENPSGGTQQEAVAFDMAFVARGETIIQDIRALYERVQEEGAPGWFVYGQMAEKYLQAFIAEVKATQVEVADEITELTQGTVIIDVPRD